MTLSSPPPPAVAEAPRSPSPAPGRAAFVFIFITVAIDMLALGVMIPVLSKLIVAFEHGGASYVRS